MLAQEQAFIFQPRAENDYLASEPPIYPKLATPINQFQLNSNSSKKKTHHEIKLLQE